MWNLSNLCSAPAFQNLEDFAVHLQKISSLEAVVQRCSVKKLFLKILQNSEGNTCARVPDCLWQLETDPQYTLECLYYKYITCNTLQHAKSFSFLNFSMFLFVSGKNLPRKKAPPPWGVRDRVRVRLGIGLGLDSGGVFSGGFFPRTVFDIYRFHKSARLLLHNAFEIPLNCFFVVWLVFVKFPRVNLILNCLQFQSFFGLFVSVDCFYSKEHVLQL